MANVHSSILIQA